MTEFQLLAQAASDAPTLYFLGGGEVPAFSSGADANVVLLSGADWYRDFSPWPAAALRRGGSAFAGQGEAYLQFLTRQMLPEIESTLHLAPSRRALTGYSLAGLFSLFALTKSAFFQGCACMSGSLWYPGWTDYLEAAVFPAPPAFVYLSLGDREGKARDPLLASVDACTQKTLRLLRDRNIPCDFVSHPGGHFTNVDERITQGICALARALQ